MTNCMVARGTRHRQVNSGFTLIEVLVAVVVLSFGLLGMVGLQAASLQANRDARLQSTAILLARELAESMRGNKNVAIKPANPYLGAFSAPSLTPAAPSYCLNAGAAPCATPEDVARAQLTEWLGRVADQLPGARVSICADAAPFDGGGLPVWGCTPPTSINSGLVIKIGWTRPALRRATTAAESGLDLAVRPSVVLPVTPGSTS
jgi:type IV pilus assembly protein PilV